MMGDKDEIERRVIEHIKLVGLSESDLSRYPHQFSGGQRQRICIARALMCDSGILVLDEPTSALDVKLAKQIIKLLIELQQTKQLSYILITHNLGVVTELAQRTLVMHQGEIIESNTTAAILTDPQHKLTKQLLAAVPTL